jgi:hypothetical protein
MKRLGLALFMLIASCGDEPPRVSATVIMSGLVGVESLRIFAFGPRLSDDIILTCTALLTPTIASDDGRLDLLAWADVDVADEILLDNIAPGEGIVAFVEAYDQDDTLIGRGCTEEVTVESGKTTNVEVVVAGI